jgi:hypothetical protein
MTFVDENATVSSHNVQAEPEPAAKLQKLRVMQCSTQDLAETPAVSPSAKDQQLSVTYAQAALAVFTKTCSSAKASAMKGVSCSAASRAKVAAWWRAKAPLRKVRRAVKCGQEKIRANLNQQKFQAALCAGKKRFKMGCAKLQVKHFLRASQRKLLSRFHCLQPAPAQATAATVAAVDSVEMSSTQLPGEVQQMGPTAAAVTIVERSSAQCAEEAKLQPENIEELEQNAPTATAAAADTFGTLPVEELSGAQPVGLAEQHDSADIEQMSGLSELAFEEQLGFAQNEEKEEQEAAYAIADVEVPMEFEADVADEPMEGEVEFEADVAEAPMEGEVEFEADVAEEPLEGEVDVDTSAHSLVYADGLDVPPEQNAWVPYIDPTSGHTCYWNQHTGEISY